MNEVFKTYNGKREVTLRDAPTFAHEIRGVFTKTVRTKENLTYSRTTVKTFNTCGAARAAAKKFCTT